MHLTLHLLLRVRPSCPAPLWGSEPPGWKTSALSSSLFGLMLHLMEQGSDVGRASFLSAPLNKSVRSLNAG